MPQLSSLLRVAAVGVALGVGPVVLPPAARSQEAAGTAAQPLVWPLPPERPRIRFVAEYRSVADFQKKKRTSRWKAMLLGEDPAAPEIEAMVKPYGIAALGDGRFWVSDTGARRVFAYDPAARRVGFVGERGNGRVAKPIGVAVDGDGRVFVADATLNRVFGYSASGALSIAIGREGELESPSGLAIDRERRVLYVADARKHQVLCYSAENGTFLRAMGTRGLQPGEFNFPTNLFVDRQGRLYVADTMNFRVQVFDADGRFIRAIGSHGDTPGSFNRPKGVGVDREGHIYVADTSFNNFQIFDSEGQLLLFVGTSGRGHGEFLLPAGLFVDEADRIYVADQGNSRVQVFQYLGDNAVSGALNLPAARGGQFVSAPVPGEQR